MTNHRDPRNRARTQPRYLIAHLFAIVLVFTIGAAPMAFSQSPSPESPGEELVLVPEEGEENRANEERSFANTVGPIAFFVTVTILIMFLWNLGRFVLFASDSDEKQRGKERAFAWLIALVLFVSLWVAFGFIRNTISVGKEGKGPIPLPRGANTTLNN